MTATAKKLLTAEDFLLLPDNGKRLSLVRGEVVAEALSGAQHGIIVARVGARLACRSSECGAGIVGCPSGFVLARDPDTVRGPDIFFVRADRIPPGGIPEGFFEGAPDVAVEIIGPADREVDLREKVGDFLAAGAFLALVVYPRTRELVAHTPDGLARTCRADEVFTAPELLPGFACPVAELFA